MIVLLLNEANFEYDVQGLIRSFYPTVNLETRYTPGAEPEDSAPKKHFDEPEEFTLSVEYHERSSANAFDQISVFIIEGSETKLSSTIDVDQSDRKDTKNRLKRQVYELLSEYTGKTLPWGTLTGIRPTKIPLRMMEEAGTSDIAGEIGQYMKETYLISDEKRDLGISVAAKEYEILKGVDYDNGYSLYIGIAFCPSTCLYCSFPSYAIASYSGQVEKYLDAIYKEIDFLAESIPDKELTTIYIGGGTPTSLSAEQLDALFTRIETRLDLSHLREYTVEAGRPDSITRDKLLTMKAHGIDRISINPQTMKQETLRLIGRHHTIEQVLESYKLAREVSDWTINMDLILGLPGEDVDDVAHTLEEVVKLQPDNLTVHSLALKRSARLNIEWDKYRSYLMENSDRHMALAHEAARKLQMEAYYLYRQKNMAGNLENVGFATPGREGLYNILIMEEKQTIMALGAGSSCKYVTDGGLTVTRSENVKDVGTYIDRIDEMIDRKRIKLEEIGWL